MDANTQWVLAATLLLGLSSGVLGSFAILKKYSLIGDAMAHAALPGICIAFMLVGTKSIGWFLVGAVIAGLLASYVITVVPKYSRIKEDTALGLVLSVFFGFGIVLLTFNFPSLSLEPESVAPQPATTTIIIESKTKLHFFNSCIFHNSSCCFL